MRSPQTNGVVERFFDTLKDEHRSRATIGDGNASPSNTAMSVWPLADPLVDWEVMT